MSKIKICGLRREADIAYVNAAAPDYIGFIFAPTSRRFVSLEQAVRLRQGLRPDIIPVGVFVNADLRTIVEHVQAGAVDMVQLHGAENAEYIRMLRSMLPDTRIIKAIRVSPTTNPVQAVCAEADYQLFDAYTEGQEGGTGKTFNWDKLNQVQENYFLAGGLDQNNVETAIRKLHPYAVDLSSGVETDGYKDAEKINRIVETVRRMK